MALAETYGPEPDLCRALRPRRLMDEPPRPPTRHPRAWHGMAAEVVEWHGPHPHIEDLRSDKPRLVAILEEVGGRLETRVAPDRPSRAKHADPHRLAFLPARTPLWTFAERFRYIRHVVIDLDVGTLTERYGLGRPMQFEPRLSFSDATVWALAQLIARECDEPGSVHGVYGDSLALVLFRDLFRCAGREPSDGTTRRLAPRQLRRVIEHME
jgi:AraC family transcriptional regulator